MATRLLYYKANDVVHPKNHVFPGIAKFSKFFDIYNAGVVFIDRTNTIKIPVNVKSLFPMPFFKPMKRTFEELCNERAKELLKKADKLKVKMGVFYSGGIDSTLVLVSLLKNATNEQKSNIKVLLSEESIGENPNFYEEHIRGKLDADSSARFPYLLGGTQMLVDGEHNDQLFGSDIVAKLIQQFGSSVLHQPYNRDIVFKFFNSSINNESETNFYLDLFERLKNAAPINIATNYDYFWWINFSLKWQTVFMRKLPFVAPRNTHNITLDYINNRYVRFYNTEDFQLWSMNNPDKKIKDTWNTYKWLCKDIIYEYTKDAEYRDNKIKRGSLHSLLLQQMSYSFIDESMNFYRELDPKEYYNPKNDFT